MAINTTNHTVYQLKGITAFSNEPAVNKRNAESGHLIIDASSSNMLTIESVTYAYNKQSVNDILDTQFNYFKFPVQVVYSPIDNDVDIAYNLEPTPELEKPDLIYARYKPSENKRLVAGPGKVILMDEVEEGLIQKRTNQYYITKEIKNSGKDLRFRIALEHRYDSGFADSAGSVSFAIMKQSVANGIMEQFIPLYDIASPGRNWWEMTQYQVKKLVEEKVILNRDFEIGDSFMLGSNANEDGFWAPNPDTDGIPADSSVTEKTRKNWYSGYKTTTRRDADGSSFNNSSNYHTINAATSYWVITDASKNVDKWNQEIQ
jgi:hypothetical protein